MPASVFACPVCHHVLHVVPHVPQATPPAMPAPTAVPTTTPGHTATDAATTTGDPLRAKIVNLKARCTRTTGRVWDLVKAVAARTQPCTRQELATDLSASAKSVLSWRRILGRSCHPQRLNISVIERTQDGKYQMPEDVRRIVNELG